ncbi:putative late blight resistance protein homolog r1b-14 [Phtheirospermum japonicum]|uniref:Putative late blight resistance protein homolog r1b-14 n=1 Tax=Phtheirospermum japonicum TaxID=374723 RepID=A0A830D9U9_9LAMI|nr:putative late blight resistance protein homolog r1b-14 [Phtheirospermum japonicum]
MAYAAVVSLVQILKQSQQSPFLNPNPQILQTLYDKLCSLQSHLEKIYPVKKSIRKTVNGLEIQIRDEIYKAQDTIESFLSNQSLKSQSDLSSTSTFLQDLQKIVSTIDPITETAKKIADSIQKDPQTGGLNPLPPSKPGSRSTRIVGQEKDLELVTGQLLKEIPQLQVVPIMGMPGIGKTTLAKSVYDDPRIERRYYTRAWVTVSSEYHVGEIFLKILGSMENMGQKSDVSDAMKKLGDRVSQQSEEHLSVQLYQSLFNTRYLIVIDDMWDQGVWDRVRKSFPDNKNGSRILLTTRIAQVADYAKSSDFRHVMSPLSLENSWTLLCDRVFGGANCPPQLVDVGRKIAENCGGLPLSLTVVGGQLSQERKTVEYWKIVEEDINAATSNSEEPYLEILSLSYNHLPGRLKGCFLYMGAFPEDSEIIVSKLIKLWVAEGFLTPRPDGLEQVAQQYLNDLIDRNLILVRKFSSDGQIKSCGIHDSIRDLAVNESRGEKFFHSINRYVRELSEGTKTQRRLSVHKNILMCMEDVYHCTKSVTLARTLVYAGPHHHHPMPFCLTFDLLRVLDALTVFFIEFPNEIVKLIHLRYLSFTYNRKLPPSISKLRNLQILIVRRHPKNIILGTSILPDEIWNMPQLRHLVFTESRLPDFSRTSSVLFENLQSLSNVDASCFTERVLQNMPNLKKLGVWIEGPRSVQFHINQLRQLEAFKFTVLNPVPGEKIDFLPKLIFPDTLKKLSLSGCGIAWEDMTVIGQLPFLEVLKLREFAFQGAEWYPEEDEFRELKFLLLESLDLEYWEADDSHFPSLERLIINHCYDLEDIPSDIGNIGGLQLIELVDCSPSAVKSARTIKEQQKDLKKGFQVRIYSSWE